MSQERASNTFNDSDSNKNNDNLRNESDYHPSANSPYIPYDSEYELEPDDIKKYASFTKDHFNHLAAVVEINRKIKLANESIFKIQTEKLELETNYTTLK